MRAGSACASHQTLSAEAASVLKHSLSLARRRGHGQVTPLHVAATLLTSRASLLRRACLRSQPHQHPLQCRALELCFNVALNRLPATPGPLLAAQPSLSNALVAALKRAQAHQRRGCVDQQQPLAPVKVDLDQIVVSILDDPSVSRVMREAGFSSAAVKNHLEDAANSNSVFHCYNINNANTSGGIYSTPNSPPPAETFNPNPISTSTSAFLHSYPADRNPFLLSPPKKPTNNFPSEDVKTVMEALLRNKNRGKNTVVVGDGAGDSLPMAETVVAEIMERVERGNVSEGLKSAHFIKLELSSAPIRFMKRDEVEMNISELKKKVDSFGSSSSGGVVICTGDLRWAVDDDDDKEDNNYRPVEHLVAEIGKLLSSYSNINGDNRVWLMGSANYQTYMKCQMKQPPLDVQWALQAVSVPTAGLGLSLSGKESRINLVKTPEMTQSLFAPDEVETLTCCPECKSNYEREVSFKSIQRKSSPLHSASDVECSGSPHLPFWLKPYAIGNLVKDDLVQLRRKYNKLCQSLHKNNPNSMISNQRDYSYPSSYTCLPNKRSLFADSETILFGGNYPSVKANRTASSLPRFRRQQSCHIDFSFSNGSSKCDSLAGPNLDSLKVSDDKEVKITLALGNLRYNEEVGLDENNNASLVKLFQENVPWQSEIIPSILVALSTDHSKAKCGDEFILIKGNDQVGKRRIAVGIAEFVLGSSDFLVRVNMRKGVGSIEKMEKALRDLEKVAFLVEDVDCGDCEFFSNFLDEGYERGSGRAIFILTMDEKSRRGKDVKENIDSVIHMKLVVDHGNNLDHNKRKVDWDFPVIRNKSFRNNEISTGVLDLNMEVDDQEVEVDGQVRFLDKIKNCFVLNRDSDKEVCGKGMFLHKLKRAFEEANSNGILSSFGADENVLEEVFKGSGLYLNTLFEKWLKEVFLTSVRRLDSGEGERVSIRLCLGGGKEGSCHEDGFMGTCLPKSIQL